MNETAERLIRKELGQSTDDILRERRRISVSSIKEELMEEYNTRSEPRLLGYNHEDIPQYLYDEDRITNMHIIGAPGQGKSRLIQALVRGDVQRGIAACVFDPSNNGDGVYSLLRWCIAEGFNKVCLIDPHDRQLAIPTIAPRHNLMNTVRILFKSTDSSDTPRISKYLPSLFYTLRKTNMSLYEMRYFAEYDDLLYAQRRNTIFAKLHPLNDRRIKLLGAFRRPNVFVNQFESTINRLEPFRQEYMGLMFGLRPQLGKDGKVVPETTCIDFQKLIREGWLILVNADHTRVEHEFDMVHARLITACIINELIDAKARMVAGGFVRPLNLYIDEVGMFGIRSIADVMDYRRKLNICLTMAHQRSSQFEDKMVLDAVESAGTRVMFYTINEGDRLNAARSQYGGDLADRTVSYNLKDIGKQRASFKINKRKAMMIYLRDVPDDHIPATKVEAFKQMLYKRDPWYHTPAEILKQINDRFERRGDHAKGTSGASDTKEVKVGTPHDSSPTSADIPVRPQRKSSRDVLSEIGERLSVPKELSQDQGLAEKKQRIGKPSPDKAVRRKQGPKTPKGGPE